MPSWQRGYRLQVASAEGLKRGGKWAWVLSTLGHGAGCTAFVSDHYRVYRSYETATLSVDRLLGDSFATPKVPCDCLKVGLDFVSTDLQAVARHFGRRELIA